MSFNGYHMVDKEKHSQGFRLLVVQLFFEFIVVKLKFVTLHLRDFGYRILT